MKNHIELPLYVKQWYFFRAVVRTISLLYMMYGWYMSNDYTHHPTCIDEFLFDFCTNEPCTGIILGGA